MDNITITTTALCQRRKAIQSRITPKKKAFARWVETFRPKYRVLYRITGIRQIENRPRLKVKVQFMPYLVFDDDTMMQNFFEETFSFYVEFTNVQNCRDHWVSARATIKEYQTQPMTMQLPNQHPSLTIKEVMSRVAFPAGVREQYYSDHIPGFKTLAKQNFYAFHLFFRMADDPAKRYGIIDQMWDQHHHALTLDQFPELELPTDELKPQLSPDAPANLPSLDNFFSKTSLNSSWAKILPPIS